MATRFNVRCIAAVAGLVIALGFAHAACPTSDQLFPRVQQCFTTIGIDSTTKFNVEAVNAFCTDNSYTSALECVGNIYTECTSDNQEMKDVLDKFINVDKFRMTFEQICQQLPVIQSNAVCIELASGPNAQCIQNQRQTFERDITENGNNNNLKATVPFFCSYWNRVAECTAMEYNTCGEEIQEIVMKTMNFIIPNACSDYQIQLNPMTSNQLGANSNAFIAVFAAMVTSTLSAIAITR